MAFGDDEPRTHVPDPDAWYEWLREHHATVPATWLMIAKKGSEQQSVGRAEAVKAALCWGWIDGQAARHDDDFSLIASRRVARGRSGARSTSATWLSCSPPAACSRPAWRRWRQPRRAAAFEALSSANRFAFRYRIETAKRPGTKAKHVAKTLEMLARGETYH